MIDLNQKNLLNANEKNVINTIRKYRKRYADKFNKNEIAAVLNIQWTTVANTLNALVDKGMLKRDGDLALIPSYEYYVGISVGSSRLKIVFLNFCFEYIKRDEFNKYIEPYDNFLREYKQYVEHSEDMRLCLNLNLEESVIKSPAFLLNAICDMLSKMKVLGAPIGAVGFAFPGIIDIQNKKIISSYLFGNAFSIGLDDLIEEEVFQKFEKCFSTEDIYFLDQNSNAATVAEKEFADITEENVAVIYGGYGYGLGLVLGNKLQPNGGQLGHMIVVKNEEVENKETEAFCRCGQKNCLENRINTDVYDKIQGKEKDLKAKTVEVLIQILNEDITGRKKRIFADYLSQAIYNIIQFVGVKNIILTGKLSKLYSCISIELKNALIEKNITSQIMKTSELGEYAAAVGIAIEAFYSKYNIPLEWKY